jgi:hypothetical protein
MRGWQGQPRKMVEYKHWQKKKSQTFNRWAVGWQFGGAEKSPYAIALQNSSTIFRHAVRRAINSRCLVL